jgi:hypothetical protein
MNTNVAPFDRALRSGLGMLLVLSPLLELNTFPYSLLGIVPLVTGVGGFCPLYAAFRKRPQTHTQTAPAT